MLSRACDYHRKCANRKCSLRHVTIIEFNGNLIFNWSLHSSKSMLHLGYPIRNFFLFYQIQIVVLDGKYMYKIN